MELWLREGLFHAPPIPRITGTSNDDTLPGTAGNDNHYGEAGNDSLDGGTGIDSVMGSGGADTMYGGLGLDTLDGGAGADLIVFDSTPAVGNVDTIQNFNVADDTIQLLRYWSFSALPATGTLAASAFWSGAGVTAGHDADDRIVFNTSTGALYYDADGNGANAAVQFATLVGVVGTLSAADFVVV